MFVLRVSRLRRKTLMSWSNGATGKFGQARTFGEATR